MSDGSRGTTGSADTDAVTEAMRAFRQMQADHPQFCGGCDECEGRTAATAIAALTADRERLQAALGEAEGREQQLISDTVRSHSERWDAEARAERAEAERDELRVKVKDAQTWCDAVAEQHDAKDAEFVNAWRQLTADRDRLQRTLDSVVAACGPDDVQYGLANDAIKAVERNCQRAAIRGIIDADRAPTTGEGE